jgi:hypothetical protein
MAVTDRRITSAVDCLRTRLRGTLLTPGDREYDASRRVWNAHVDRRPAVIAQCAGAADVVAAVALRAVCPRGDLRAARHARRMGRHAAGAPPGVLALDSHRPPTGDAWPSCGRFCSRHMFGHAGWRSSVAFTDPEHGVVLAATANGTATNDISYRRLHDVCTAVDVDLCLQPAPRGAAHR